MTRLRRSHTLPIWLGGAAANKLEHPTKRTAGSASTKIPFATAPPKRLSSASLPLVCVMASCNQATTKHPLSVLEFCRWWLVFAPRTCSYRQKIPVGMTSDPYSTQNQNLKTCFAPNSSGSGINWKPKPNRHALQTSQHEPERAERTMPSQQRTSHKNFSQNKPPNFHLFL